jgi:hypothetical protein
MSKPRVTTQIVTNANLGAQPIVSSIIDTWQVDAGSLEIQAVGSGISGTSVLTIEASNQYDPKTNPTPTFVPMSLASPVTPAFAVLGTTGGSFIYSFLPPALAPRFIRLRLAGGTGSGTLNVFANVTGAA